MLLGLYIIVDDDFDAPVYADPDPGELDDPVWSEACERVHDALEGEGEARGQALVGEVVVAWRCQIKEGLSFVAIGRHVKARDLDAYLRQVADRYADEVEDLRDPGAGLADVLVDVIPPWDEDDD